MTEQLQLESVPLNALDRCDRCGAQAYVRAVLLNGGELMFCAHHGKEYAEKLKPLAAKIQDESEKLIEATTVLTYLSPFPCSSLWNRKPHLLIPRSLYLIFFT